MVSKVPSERVQRARMRRAHGWEAQNTITIQGYRSSFLYRIDTLLSIHRHRDIDAKIAWMKQSQE